MRNALRGGRQWVVIKTYWNGTSYYFFNADVISRLGSSLSGCRLQEHSEGVDYDDILTDRLVSMACTPSFFLSPQSLPFTWWQTFLLGGKNFRQGSFGGSADIETVFMQATLVRFSTVSLH